MERYISRGGTWFNGAVISDDSSSECSDIYPCADLRCQEEKEPKRTQESSIEPLDFRVSYWGDLIRNSDPNEWGVMEEVLSDKKGTGGKEPVHSLKRRRVGAID